MGNMNGINNNMINNGGNMMFN